MLKTFNQNINRKGNYADLQGQKPKFQNLLIPLYLVVMFPIVSNSGMYFTHLDTS